MLVACGALLAAIACEPGGRSEYEVDGDTGAAAPATTLDQNTAKSIGPDSTTGQGGRSGAPAMAGDTLGARPAPDDTARARPPQP